MTGFTFLLIAACFLSVQGNSSISRLINPVTSKGRATKLSLRNVFSYAILEVEFLSHTTVSDRQKVVIKGGSIDKTCDVNLQSYKNCQLIGDYSENDLNYRYNCSGPLSNAYITYDHVKSAMAGNMFMVESMPAVTEDPAAVNEILADPKTKHNLIKEKIIPGLKYRGYFVMFGESSVALAVSGGKPVIVQSNIGQGKIIAAAHHDYHKTLLTDLDLDTSRVVDVTMRSLKYLSTLSGGYIYKWNLHRQLDEGKVEHLLQMVRKGATLMVYITPWYYESYDGKYQDASWLPVLGEAGIWPVEKGIIWNSQKMKLGGDEANWVHSIPVHVQLAMNSLSELKNCGAVFDHSISLPNKMIRNTTFVSIDLLEDVRELLQRWEAHVGLIAPCYDRYTRKEEEKELILIYNSILLSPLVKNFKAPAYFAYPGAVDESQLEEITISQKIGIKEEVYPIGLYLPPGRESVVKVKNGHASDCRLIVGWNFIDASGRNYFRKWPKMAIYFNYGIDQQVLSSPFGGIIWMTCDSAKDSDITLSVSKVVRTVTFDMKDAQHKALSSESRRSPSPWAILAGESIVFALPSASVRNMDDPSTILKLLDQGVKSELELADLSLATRHREVVALDFQIKMGTMHSGYPIGAVIYRANPSSRSFLLNYANTKKSGSFGLFHEVGHNLVDSAILFEGSEEVMNNIFTVRAQQSLLNTDLFSLGWYNEKSVGDYVFSPNENLIQQRPKDALTVFIQLAHHFGWKLWHSLFAEYRAMSSSDKEAIQDKKETLIIKLSKIVNYNLIPLFEFWGYSITEKAKKELTSLLIFFPDDKIVRLHYDIGMFFKKYPKAVRKVVKL